MLSWFRRRTTDKSTPRRPDRSVEVPLRSLEDKRSTLRRVKSDESEYIKPLIESITLESEGNQHVDFRNQIKDIFKDIEESKIADPELINNIERLIQINGLIKKRLQFATTGYDDISLLHAASRACRSELCQYFMDVIQIDKNVKSKSKLTPLHILIKSNTFSQDEKSYVKHLTYRGTDHLTKRSKFDRTLQVLIDNDCDCNAQDELGFTALHYAVLKSNKDTVVTLTSLPTIQFNVEDHKHMTPLHLACKYGFFDIVDLLIDKIEPRDFLIFNTNSPDIQLLHLMCKNKTENPKLVRKILEKIRQVSVFDLNEQLQRMDQNRQTILQIAIENNHLKTLEMLLKEFYVTEELREDRNGNLPIHHAAKVPGSDVLNVLIENNAFSFKTNGNYENALHVAASNNRFKFITDFMAHEKLLVEKKDPMITKDYVPCVKGINRSGYTPMFVALIVGNLKCVEALLTTENLDLETKGPYGNSIYHICAEYNNFEALRVFLTKKDQRFVEPLYIRNNKEDSVIHTASYHGNLEIIKIVVSKIFDGFSSLETYLTTKNLEGFTSFHIACVKGHFNIVEYFLRDLKIAYFLEQLDNDANTPLHLASLHGHLSIVDILLAYGADLNAKNRQGNTALELSCRKGFFDISKTLIMHYTSIQSMGSDSVGSGSGNDENPLHIACHEGAHEVVDLLLSKGAPIDLVNKGNKNCLDISIAKGHREVVRVLLNHSRWNELIHTSVNDRSDLKVNVTNLAFKNQINRYKSSGRKENPQLVAMFEHKMWDSIKIVLDKCRKDNQYDFSKLDPDCRNIEKHPLMLMARSGQETLLKHETTQTLLNLKWRFIPRFAFYFNLLLYLVFLVLFAIYSVELSRLVRVSEDENPEEKLGNIETDSTLRGCLIGIIMVNMFKMLFQLLLVDGLAFMTSLQNIGETLSFLLALWATFSPQYYTKINVSSATVLLSFIVFSFLTQKLKMFGLYVLAFKRTIRNSTKFFPIFFLIYLGFTLSFSIRTHFGVSYYNASAGLSAVRTLSMALGELANEDMGLETNLFLNYLIYFLFIGLVCIITFNLFVGIAVGEIKTVLDEADVQQISMRIAFVLKVQKTLAKFHQMNMLKFMSVRFDKYDYDQDEFRYIKTKDRMVGFFRSYFVSIEPDIKLVDPIKRLEDNLLELSRHTSYELKNIRDLLTNQLNDVEIKLSNSQQRLEDTLVEMSRKTKNNFESTAQATAAQLDGVENNLVDSQHHITNTIQDLNLLTAQKMVELKVEYADQVSTLRTQMQKSLSDFSASINRIILDQMGNVNVNLNNLFGMLNGIQGEVDKIKDNQDTLLDLTKKMEYQYAEFVIDKEVKETLNEIVNQLVLDDRADDTDEFEDDDSQDEDDRADENTLSGDHDEDQSDDDNDINNPTS